jgi:hypothetical protein
MEFRISTLLCIVMIALTACGGEPEQVKMDRRFLTESALEDQLDELRTAVNGEVLDQHTWVDGEEKVFSLLSREYDETGDYVGIFLRHYIVGVQSPKLLWTYQDSISCSGSGAAAGAMLVENTSPKLRPASVLGGDEQQFVLRYVLNCSATNSRTEAGKTLVLINTLSGTPELRLEGGTPWGQQLTMLDEEQAAVLRELWEG